MKIILLCFTIVVSIGFQNVFAQRREVIVSGNEDRHVLSKVDLMQFLGNWKSIDGSYSVEITRSVTKLNDQVFRTEQDTLVMKSVSKDNNSVKHAIVFPNHLNFFWVNVYQAMTAVWDPVALRFEIYILAPRAPGFLEFIKSHLIDPKNKLSNYTAEKVMLKKCE